MESWQWAEEAEARMKAPQALAEELGLRPEEVLPYGRTLAKLDAEAVLTRLQGPPTARYVDVTAITPTPFGEGKTTTTLGLVQGLGRLGHRATAAIRQPSSGPTFNVKGSGAGSGRAQCIPVGPLSVGLTGDIDAVVNANNLAMTALTARLLHERQYDDARLAARGLRRLDMDPARVSLRWAMDFCAQALRHITIGQGAATDGVTMASGFQIAAASEIMAILSVALSRADLRARLARMVVAHDRQGRPVTTADLEVDGAMAAWMTRALDPNLLQTLEGQAVLVHAGPFANIALGQSSVLADRIGVRLGDFHVTESGFGADIGYEKFWNLKCRFSGLHPHAVVVVATVRALKMHGGGPAVKPGVALPEAYTREDVGLVERGFENLHAHMDIVRRSGMRPIVCVNRFTGDTQAEIGAIRRLAEAAGAVAVTSDHWRAGGDGARELAEAVAAMCATRQAFAPLYPPGTPLRRRIEIVAREVYGAAGVAYSPEAETCLRALEADADTAGLGLCMAKTHLSLSHDPSFKGRPVGWVLPVNSVEVFRGAGLVVPLTGSIQLMPGTGSDPSFRRIDISTTTGRITGLR